MKLEILNKPIKEYAQFSAPLEIFMGILDCQKEDRVVGVGYEGSRIWGYISLNKMGEIFIYVDREVRGRGSGKELLKLFLAQMNSKWSAGIFHAEIANDNVASLIIFLKNGFKITSERNSSRSHCLQLIWSASEKRNAVEDLPF